MKLRYLFSALLTSVLLFTGCVQEPIGSLENIKLSKTNVAIPADGGQVEVTLTTTSDWAFVETEAWPRVLAYVKDENNKDKKDENGNKIVDEEKTVPSWLSLKEGPMSGAAGEYKLVFEAEAVQGGRDITLEILAGNFSQYIIVRQGSKNVEEATCADVLAGPDGKTYRVTGVCSSIGNTTYGNWYLNDGTGEVYIYGTLDKDGATKNFSSWGMEPGDIVTVEGPKTTYNGTVELVDVTVLNIEKSLLKIVNTPDAIAKEGGEYQIKLAYKGAGVQPSIPAENEDGEPVDYREWISVVDIATIYGEATKQEPNPADTAVVTFKVLPNEAGTREGKINFTSGTGEASSTISYDFSQEGSIIETTADKINAAEDGATLYRITGVVKSIVKAQYGNLYLADYTGEVYVYGTYDADGNRFDAFATPVKEGDIITVCGVKSSYNGSPQMKNVTMEKHIQVSAVTVDEFLAAPESTDAYYLLTGAMKNIKLNDDGTQNVYGNFDLVDEAGSSVYVYGLLSGWGGPKKEFQSLDLKEGDVVTLIGNRASYNGTAQVGNAFYVSHEEGAPAADPWAGENVVSYEMPEFMFTDYPQYCALTELKAYADETNLYARLKTTKTSGVAKLRLCTADTNEGTETVWYWENSFYSTPVYKSDKASVDSDFNFSLSYNGSAVTLKTVVDGDNVYWEMTIPRSAHDHTSAAGAVNLGFVSYDASGAENGLMPKVWGEMLKVTLP